MPTAPGTRTSPFPRDKSSFGPFDRLDELSKQRVRGIIEQAAASHAGHGTPEQQIGDYYAAYMDEAAIEANGLAPAQPGPGPHRGRQQPCRLARLFGTVGFASLFDVQFPADFKNPDRYAVFIASRRWGCPTATITSRMIRS